MRTVAIIQARMGSTRLPGKVMRKIDGHPMIAYIIDRVQKIADIDQLILATSTNEREKPLVEYVQARGVNIFRGPEEDVLSRYYHAARQFEADIILRVTGDNPFVDRPVAEELIKMVREGCDYASNNLVRTYPYGIDLEAFTMNTLVETHQKADNPNHREHVTQYIHQNTEGFTLCNLEYSHDYSNIRLTVDTEEDFIQAQDIIEEYGGNARFEDFIEEI